VLEEANIERSQVYGDKCRKALQVGAGGKRRIHEKPTMREIKPAGHGSTQELESCRSQTHRLPWCDRAQALLGSILR